jgi:hypothetical protein
MPILFLGVCVLRSEKVVSVVKYQLILDTEGLIEG